MQEWVNRTNPAAAEMNRRLEDQLKAARPPNPFGMP